MNVSVSGRDHSERDTLRHAIISIINVSSSITPAAIIGTNEGSPATDNPTAEISISHHAQEQELKNNRA